MINDEERMRQLIFTDHKLAKIETEWERALRTFDFAGAYADCKSVADVMTMFKQCYKLGYADGLVDGHNGAAAMIKKEMNID
jgi:hypothetical protein